LSKGCPFLRAQVRGAKKKDSASTSSAWAGLGSAEWDLRARTLAGPAGLALFLAGAIAESGVLDPHSGNAALSGVQVEVLAAA
jgi:hypothetical protein